MIKPILYINKFIKENGFTPIYMKVYIHGKYVKIKMPVEIQPDMWDSKKQIIVGLNAKQNNLILKERVGRASDIMLKYHVNEQTLTADLFKKEFSNPAILTNLYEFMKDAVMKRHTITDSTKKGHLSVVEKLKLFKPAALLIEIDYDWLQSYTRFCKNKGNSTNTIHRDFKILKKYINDAIRQGLLKKNPFDYFKAKKDKDYPTYLTEEERDELVKLYEQNYLPDRYQKCLRQFLFSCYTGLRVSDMKTIRFEQISSKGVLRFKPVKSLNINAIQIDLTLPEYAKKLIKDENPVGLKGIIFKEYKEQRINMYIKEVAKVAKIDKSLHMHVARHTFATIFLRHCTQANGILILQKILGHSKLESTMVYMHIIETDIEDAMSTFK